MLRNKLVEYLQVACFLVVHVLHQRPKVRVGADHVGGLGGVDEGRCEFTSLVDAQGTFEELSLLLAEGVSRFGGTGSAGGRRMSALGAHSCRGEEIEIDRGCGPRRTSELSQEASS